MRLWRGASLRARLLTATGLIVVVSVGLTLGVGLVLTRRAVERSTLDEVTRKADLLASFEGSQLLVCSHPLQPFLATGSEHAACTPLAGASPYLSARQMKLLREGRGVQGTVRVDGTAYYVAARPVKRHAVVFLRAKQIGSSWHPYLEGLLIAGLAGASLAAAISILLARAIRRPVVRVAAASRSLAAGEEHRELPVEGTGELAQLSQSFNEMAEQLAHAREAEQAFLLSVSHELKTPLTSIRGYAEGLGDGAVPREEAAGVIRREARRLERLVQDLLDIARMNRSSFAVHREPVDLAETARDAGRRYAAQAENFGLALAVDAPDEAPALGDADRVLQVLSNLVENALRCTPAGGRVSVRARPGELEVTDTGPGLPPEELPRAFERFFLYRRHGADRAVGTGLGLAIVKELTEAMGGRVDVRSRPGEGTAFRVSLPLAEAAVHHRGLGSGRNPLPEQREPAVPVHEPDDAGVAAQPPVAVDDAEGSRGVDPVGDRDDVVVHARFDGPA